MWRTNGIRYVFGEQIVCTTSKWDVDNNKAVRSRCFSLNFISWVDICGRSVQRRIFENCSQFYSIRLGTETIVCFFRFNFVHAVTAWRDKKIFCTVSFFISKSIDVGECSNFALAQWKLIQKPPEFKIIRLARISHLFTSDKIERSNF